MGKIIKEGCRLISIYEFKKWKRLTGYNSGLITWTSGYSEKKNSINYILNLLDQESMHLELSYTMTDHWTNEKHEIKHKYPIVTAPCNLGGKRYWIKCSIYSNGRYCGRRVAKLYLGGGSHYFACRHCYGLSYESRNLSGYSKAIGTIVSVPDLDEAKEKVKRKYYAGKITRCYKNYLKKENRFHNQLIGIEHYLTKNKK